MGVNLWAGGVYHQRIIALGVGTVGFTPGLYCQSYSGGACASSVFDQLLWFVNTNIHCALKCQATVNTASKNYSDGG